MAPWVARPVPYVAIWQNTFAGLDTGGGQPALWESLAPGSPA